MEALLLALGVVGLAIFVAIRKGRSDQKSEQAEETLDGLKESKEARDSLRDPKQRQWLRDFFKKHNK